MSDYSEFGPPVYDTVSPNRRSSGEFISDLAANGIIAQEQVGETLFSSDGFYVNPKVQNKYFLYSSAQIDGLEFEQYIASYYPNMAVTMQYFVAVLAIKLPRATAPLLVFSRTTKTLNFVMGFASLPLIKGLSTVKLDNNFSEFFTVYSREGRIIDAYTTLVPNLMLNILEDGSDYCVEFARDKIYIYKIFNSVEGNKDGSGGAIFDFSVEAYKAMRDFGLKHAKHFARAARPSRGEFTEDLTPFWQTFDQDIESVNKRQIRFIVLLFAYVILAVFLWFLVIPATVVWVWIRWHIWSGRRERLLQEWRARGGDLS